MARESDSTTSAAHLQDTATDKRQAEAFADFIRQRRIGLGLSLRQLSRLTGIAHTNLFQWENNRRQIDSLDRLIPLARALDVPLADLCERAGQDFTGSLPHVTPYLHLKYGAHVPTDVLHSLVAHCENVLADHGIQALADQS